MRISQESELDSENCGCSPVLSPLSTESHTENDLLVTLSLPLIRDTNYVIQVEDFNAGVISITVLSFILWICSQVQPAKNKEELNNNESNIILDPGL